MTGCRCGATPTFRATSLTWRFSSPFISSRRISSSVAAMAGPDAKNPRSAPTGISLRKTFIARTFLDIINRCAPEAGILASAGCKTRGLLS